MTGSPRRPSALIVPWAVASMLLLLVGCTPFGPHTDADLLPPGRYVCWSHFYSTATQSTNATALGIGIEVDRDHYTVTDGDGGSYSYSSDDDGVTWEDGSLAGIPTTYRQNDNGHVLTLRREDDATQGQWVCTNGAQPRGSGGSIIGMPPPLVPLGDVAELPHGWTVRVLDVRRDATEAVLAHNEFNEPPPPDHQYLIVAVELDRGSSEEDTFSAGELVLVSTTGHVYSASVDRCGVHPGALDTRRLSIGESATGNICWSVPSTDAASVHLEFRNGMVAGPPVGFALS